MDSLSQATLGAAIGAAIGGQKYGVKKAAIIGAICGTVPDLDVFLSGESDPVTAFTYHRGFTHSLIFCILASPILAWLFTRIKYFGAAFKEKRLHLMIFLMLFTHIILDALTVYGTQIFWGISSSSLYGYGIKPVSIGSIFIIDPLYTLPLLWFLTTSLYQKTRRAVTVGLILSTLYLGFGLGAQKYVTHIFEQNYNQPYQKALVQTTPFNTLLWRILVMKDDGYAVGYYSLFDKSLDTDFQTFKSQEKLIEPIKDSFAVSRLQWFTDGYYAVTEKDNHIIMRDLRMGLEPDSYVFGFKVGHIEKDGTVIEMLNKRYASTREMNRLKKLWQRIWDETVRF